MKNKKLARQEVTRLAGLTSKQCFSCRRFATFWKVPGNSVKARANRPFLICMFCFPISNLRSGRSVLPLFSPFPPLPPPPKKNAWSQVIPFQPRDVYPFGIMCQALVWTCIARTKATLTLHQITFAPTTLLFTHKKWVISVRFLAWIRVVGNDSKQSDEIQATRFL